MHKLKKYLASFILLALALPGVSHAWWDAAWTARSKITLNTSATGADTREALVQVPVLLRLHSGNFSFIDAKEDAGDLRFIAGDDKTPLKYHIDQFDSLDELALIWVQVPTLASASDAGFIYVYYGNELAASASDAKGSYDVNQTAVLHLSEKEGPSKDATAYANNAASAGAKPSATAAIGTGASLDGTGAIVIPATPSLQIAAGGGLTFSAWIKIAGSQQDAIVFAQEDAANGLIVAVDQLQVYARATTDGTPVETPRSGALTPGTWHHLAVTLSDRLVIYLDGLEVATLAATAPALTAGVSLGGTTSAVALAADAADAATSADAEAQVSETATAEPPAATSPAILEERGEEGGEAAATPAAGAVAQAFTGELDEVQISNVARSADWIKVAALSQGPGAKLLAYGPAEAGEAATEETASYFAILLQSVTIDGWVIIGILGVMALISLFVMFGKAIFLSRSRRANKKFLAEFQRVTNEMAQQEHLAHGELAENATATQLPLLYRLEPRFKNSSLYRVYQVGVRELAHRVAMYQRSGKPVNLSPQAIEAIKASIDGGIVRESHRLSSQMVLLTIAISGGPFLGLLGTVVGVMITFAAIAASGDVNVNAIAPGIAAALVATVAGLAVAIPALFAYNYLSVQIKNITAELRIFSDEFITRLAENYAI